MFSFFLALHLYRLQNLALSNLDLDLPSTCRGLIIQFLYDGRADGYLKDVLDDEWVDVLGDLVEE